MLRQQLGIAGSSHRRLFPVSKRAVLCERHPTLHPLPLRLPMLHPSLGDGRKPIRDTQQRSRSSRISSSIRSTFFNATNSVYLCSTSKPTILPPSSTLSTKPSAPTRATLPTRSTAPTRSESRISHNQSMEYTTTTPAWT